MTLSQPRLHIIWGAPRHVAMGNIARICGFNQCCSSARKTSHQKRWNIRFRIQGTVLLKKGLIFFSQPENTLFRIFRMVYYSIVLEVAVHRGRGLMTIFCALAKDPRNLLGREWDLPHLEDILKDRCWEW